MFGILTSPQSLLQALYQVRPDFPDSLRILLYLEAPSRRPGSHVYKVLRLYFRYC